MYKRQGDIKHTIGNMKNYASKKKISATARMETITGNQSYENRRNQLLKNRENAQKIKQKEKLKNIIIDMRKY